MSRDTQPLSARQQSTAIRRSARRQDVATSANKTSLEQRLGLVHPENAFFQRSSKLPPVGVLSRLREDAPAHRCQRCLSSTATRCHVQLVHLVRRRRLLPARDRPTADTDRSTVSTCLPTARSSRPSLPTSRRRRSGSVVFTARRILHSVVYGISRCPAVTTDVCRIPLTAMPDVI